MTTHSRLNIPTGLLFLLPVVATFAFVRIIPTLAAFYLSFTDYSGLESPAWVGLDNYRAVLGDEVFRRALVNTLVYTMGVIIPSVLIGLGIAILLNGRLLLRGLFRTLFFLPVVVSFVSIAMIWSYLLNPQFGVINWMLSFIGLPRIAWLDNSSTAMPTLIAIGVWKNLGYTAVIYLAGLQGIPPELHESARVDGASAWQRFRDITWPLLRPVTVFLAMMTGIIAFQAFDHILVLTAGGPANATTTVVLESYRNAFQFLRFGYASAMAFLLFVCIAAFGACMVWMRDREEAAR
jgi:ABC-type sugar transport system permease subunit